MNYDNFTTNAQKALKLGSQIAKDRNHKAIENGHLFKGILLCDKNVAPFLLKKNHIDLQEIEEKIDRIIDTYPFLTSGKLAVSSYVEKGLNKGLGLSNDLLDDYISVEHLLYGILISGDTVSSLLKSYGMNEANFIKSIQDLRKGAVPEKSEFANEYLNKYGVNINEKISSGKIDPVIGRDKEIRNILEILSRRTKNNPLILGEPGVGKTALAEGLAFRIVRGDIPENLRNNIVYSLDITALIAGASKQGEFEERLKMLIKEVQNSNGEVILFIDEIHLLVGAGKSGGPMDAANILKPAMARGDMKIIGATTLDEYRKYIERDAALVRRLQNVILEEPNTEDAISILRGIKDKFQIHHKVKIKDEAIIAAVELSQRYITDRFLPDKAIDLMDHAGSKIRLDINSLPEEIDRLERMIRQLKLEKETIKLEGDDKKVQELRERIANMSDESNALRSVWESEKGLITQILLCKENIEKIKYESEKAEKDGDFEKSAKLKHENLKEEKSKLEKFTAELSLKQSQTTLFKDEVDADTIAEIVSERTGIPLAKMQQSEVEKLLKLEESLSKRIIGQSQAIKAVSDAVRRSRAGLQDENRPIGSFIFVGTSGVGKTELAKALAEFLFDSDKSIVRFDMSEYQEKQTVSKMIGSPPGYVGYEEGGQLTEAIRRKPYSIVLFDEIEKAHPEVYNILLQVLDDGRLTDSQGRTVNFKNTIIIMTSNLGSEKILENYEKLSPTNRLELLEKNKADVSKALKEKMRPEFLNRIDEIIMFAPLAYTDIKKIVAIQSEKLIEKLENNDISLFISAMAQSWLAKMSYVPQFGARPVKRAMQRYVLNELSKQILQGLVVKDKILCIDYKEGELNITNRTAEEIDNLQTNSNFSDDQIRTKDKPVMEESIPPKVEEKAEEQQEVIEEKDKENWFVRLIRRIFGKKE